MLLTCTLALAACSADMMPARQTAPVPGKLRTFGDWVVGCDNALVCKATALSPESGEFADYLLSIERDPGPGGEVRIAFNGQREANPPIAIALDRKPLVRGGAAGDVNFRGAEAMRIAVALAGGRAATIASGGVPGPLSLTGLAAALRWIDDRQRRAGTTGALIARGRAPDRAPRPTLPTVRIVAGSGTPAVLSAAMLTDMRKTAQCDPINDPDMARPETHALGRGRTLAIVPCGFGAYQGWAGIFVVERGRAVPAPFDVAMNEGGDEPVPLLTSASFDKGELSSWAKGRGLGDCGFGQQFAWDGERFRLTEQIEMSECRGSLDLITTWRAKAVR